MNVQNLRIGKTEFEYNGYAYRLTGFYFKYYNDSGDTLLTIPCVPEDANCVSGYGIAGVIAPLDKICILKRTIPEGLFENDHDNFLEYTLKYAEELKFAKKLKPNMTNSKFNEIRTKRLFRDMGLYKR